jgi:hypothetical protein
MWDDWLESGFEVGCRDLASVEALDDLSPLNVVAPNSLPPIGTDGLVAPQPTR